MMEMGESEHFGIVHLGQVQGAQGSQEEAPLARLQSETSFPY